MKYYFEKQLSCSFEEAKERVVEALKSEGFGVISEIDLAAKMKEKLGKEFRPYLILGACNPAYAYQALQLEDKIGTMLPCNVVIQQLTPTLVEVAAVDPIASMQAIESPGLEPLAQEVRQKLMQVIEKL